MIRIAADTAKIPKGIIADFGSCCTRDAMSHNANTAKATNVAAKIA